MFVPKTHHHLIPSCLSPTSHYKQSNDIVYGNFLKEGRQNTEFFGESKLILEQPVACSVSPYPGLTRLRLLLVLLTLLLNLLQPR